MQITKISHEEFGNGQKLLSTKDFLKHDLVHYAVDKALFIYNDASPTMHTLDIERVAGLLHSVYDENVSNDEIISGAENMYSAYGEEVPPYLNHEFINRVRNMANNLVDRYKNLRTGESMELM